MGGMPISEISQLLSLPLPVALMFIGLFMTLLGFKATVFKVQVNSKSARTFLVATGIPILLMAVWLTIILVYRVAYGVPLSPPNLYPLLNLFSILNGEIVLSLIIVIILFVIGRNIIEERSYSLDAAFVISPNQNMEGRDANILVEHKGGKWFFCVARLEEAYEVLKNGKEKVLDVHQMNPNGYSFEWEESPIHDGSWGGQLSNNNPKIIHICSLTEYHSDEHDDYEYSLAFRYHGNNSPFLDMSKKYRFVIGLYREKNHAHILMKTMDGILLVKDDKLNWT